MIKVKLELCVFRRPRNRASSISVMTASIVVMASIPVVLVEMALMASIAAAVSVPVVFVKAALMALIAAAVSVPVALVETVLMASIIAVVSVFVVFVKMALMASIVVMVSVSVILVKTAFMTAFIGMVIILIAALEGGAAVPEILTSVAVLHFIGWGGGFFRPDFFLHGPVDDRAIGTVCID